MSRIASYVEQFRAPFCYCGRDKKPNKAFCPTCYWTLSSKSRDNLNKRFGNGLEEAYIAAITELKEKGIK